MVISANETDQTDECLSAKNGMKLAYAELIVINLLPLKKLLAKTSFTVTSFLTNPIAQNPFSQSESKDRLVNEY